MQAVLSAAALRQGMSMSQRDLPPLISAYPTRIDIPLEIRAYLITLLNETLGGSVDVKPGELGQATWNVEYVFMSTCPF